MCSGPEPRCALKTSRRTFKSVLHWTRASVLDSGAKVMFYGHWGWYIQLLTCSRQWCVDWIGPRLSGESWDKLACLLCRCEKPLQRSVESCWEAAYRKRTKADRFHLGVNVWFWPTASLAGSLLTCTFNSLRALVLGCGSAQSLIWIKKSSNLPAVHQLSPTPVLHCLFLFYFQHVCLLL